MSAFKPKDVYPCTVDEDKWKFEVSIENLFGHLCSSKVFRHDREMHNLVKQRNGKRARGDDASQLVIGNGDDSESDVGSNTSDEEHDRTSTSPTFPDRMWNSQCGERGSKRRRVTAATASSGVSLADVERQSIGDTRQLTEGHISTAKSKMALPSRVVTRPSYSRSDKPSQGLPSPSPKSVTTNPHRGNTSIDTSDGLHTRSIELVQSSKSSTSTAVDHDVADKRPERELVNPQKIPQGKSEEQSETQLSVADTAFETQSPQGQRKEREAAKVRHRRDAYRVIRDPSKSWEMEHGLIMSFGDHEEEEIEL